MNTPLLLRQIIQENVPNVTYEVTDAPGSTATATLDIDVIPPDDPGSNEPPVANDDTNTTDQGVAVSANVIDPNDSDPDTDQDDLKLTEITYIGTDNLPHTVSVPPGGTTVTLGDGKSGTAGSLQISRMEVIHLPQLQPIMG